MQESDSTSDLANVVNVADESNNNPHEDNSSSPDEERIGSPSSNISILSEGDEDNSLFSMFDEETAGSTHHQANVTVKIMDMEYGKSWTGKSPKQFFIDWLYKNGDKARATFSPVQGSIGGSGYMYQLEVKGGRYDGRKFAMENPYRVASLKQAENFVSVS